MKPKDKIKPKDKVGLTDDEMAVMGQDGLTHRINTFKVKSQVKFSKWFDCPIINLEFTINGHQWAAHELLYTEALVLIDELKAQVKVLEKNPTKGETK
jgi:hypothetical protein